jgi:sec-independent protein translocase protein TatA
MENAMGRIGILEIGIILLVVVILFGAKRIAGLGKSLGEGIRGFRQAVRDDGGTDGPQHPSGSS